MTLAALNLFYDPFESLMREVVRRMKRRDYDVQEPGGEYIIGLHRRLLQRGEQGPGPHDRYLKAFYNLDVDRLTVMRAIGAGSEAARLVAFDRLMSMYGSFPDFGKQAILWDLTSETVGYRNAARYCVPPGEDETPTVDASIAQLENSILLGGGEVQPLDGQNDFVHANKHLEGLTPLIQQAQQDPNMLMQVLPGVNALNQHAVIHVERLSMDPKMKVQSAEMRKTIQQADEIIHNGLMHAQKMQRQMQKAGGNGAPVNGAPVGPDGQPASPSGIDPKMELKIRGELAYREAQIQALNRESEAKLARQQAESAQKLAIQDAEAAHQMIQRR